MKAIDGPMAPKMSEADNKNLNAQAGERVILSWDGQNFDRDPKGLWWYLAASGFILLLTGFFIWRQDWFPIIVVVVVSAVLFWYLRVSVPEKIQYRITAIGIYLNDRLYPFSEIHSFWIVYNQSVKVLYIAFVRKYLPALLVDVRSVDPVILRSVLSRRIPEQEKRGESLTDRLVRILKL